jgi:hypothetical protein
VRTQKNSDSDGLNADSDTNSVPPMGIHVSPDPSGNLILFQLLSSVADPDPGSGAFLTPRSGIRDG